MWVLLLLLLLLPLYLLLLLFLLLKIGSQEGNAGFFREVSG